MAGSVSEYQPLHNNPCPEEDIHACDSHHGSLLDQQRRDDLVCNDIGRTRGSRSRKRKRSPDHDLPFKRRRGPPIHRDYIQILNRDTEDAHGKGTFADDPPLRDSTLGVTQWTSLEKAIFFESLSRLGQDGIAHFKSRLHGKSCVEVLGYLKVLRDNADARAAAGELPRMQLVEIPAALEVSEECCQALEHVADSLSLRLEYRDQKREERKWGDCWNITKQLLHDIQLEKVVVSDTVGFASLLKTKNWLVLSDRVFMNSSDPENNWRNMSATEPSIWASALEDFHALTVDFTKRLVRTAIYLAETRLRQKRKTYPNVVPILRRHDVISAVAALGVARDSRGFWARCPRRLGLNARHSNRDGCRENIGHDEAEKLLLQRGASWSNRPIISQGGDKCCEQGSLQAGQEKSETEGSDIDYEDENEAIEEDVKEALVFTASSAPPTHDSRDRIARHVAWGHQDDQKADDRDMRQSHKHEGHLWELALKRPVRPPLETFNAEQEEPVPRAPKSGLPAHLSSAGENWRRTVGYMECWEAQESQQPVLDM